jgi:hypothetical protein
MKYILSLAIIIISLQSFSQNIDTVYVRNLTFKYEEWSWIVGGINPQGLDSANKKRYKKLTKFLDDANVAGFSTNVTYDSLPGRFAMFAFNEYWTNTTARENMGTGIDSKLRLYTPLASFIATSDATRLATFINRRNAGRDQIE